jgi:hypothetical protein
MLPTQAVSHEMDQAQPILLNENLFLLREQLGRQSEALISDDRLLTMLRITKGDLAEARLTALGYILHTLKLQAEHGEGDGDQNRELSQHFSAMSATLHRERPARTVDLKVRSRGGFFQFLVKRS